ncbi:MAG TPA: pitrilysin family protein [Limnochordia bacterium]|nr:pitrilysin family protein [Limnochordia bacterium]
MKRRVLILCLAAVLAAFPALAAEPFRYTENVQKVVLPNGVTLLLKENPAFDLIALTLLSKVGSVHDPLGLEGLTYLTQRNLLSGTANRTAAELVLSLESLGVQLQTLTAPNFSGVYLQALPESFLAGYGILLDIIANSVFPAAEFERERTVGMAALQSMLDDPQYAVLFAYLEAFYGDHPYKYTAYGSLEGLATVQAELLPAWKEYVYAPEHLVVAVVGNFKTEELLPLLEETLGSWEADYAAAVEPREEVHFEHPAENREFAFNIPLDAAFLVMGYPAPDAFHEDSAPMAVIASILGGSFSSRLNMEIRDRLGLAYIVFSEYDERLGPSNFYTYVVTQPGNVELVKEQIAQHVQRIAAEGLTEAEIAEVAAYQRGLYLLQNETNLAQALLLAQAEVTGRGYQWMDEYMTFFDRVTPEDVKRVAAKYLQYYTSFVVGP